MKLRCDRLSGPMQRWWRQLNRRRRQRVLVGHSFRGGTGSGGGWARLRSRLDIQEVRLGFRRVRMCRRRECCGRSQVAPCLARGLLPVVLVDHPTPHRHQGSDQTLRGTWSRQVPAQKMVFAERRTRRAAGMPVGVGRSRSATAAGCCSLVAVSDSIICSETF